jgi:hypothetical protein
MSCNSGDERSGMNGMNIGRLPGDRSPSRLGCGDLIEMFSVGGEKDDENAEEWVKW